MSTILEQSLTFHAPRRAPGSQAAARWTVDAVAALFELPFPELT